MPFERHSEDRAAICSVRPQIFLRDRPWERSASRLPVSTSSGRASAKSCPSVSQGKSWARSNWPPFCLTPQHRRQLLIKYFSNKDLSVWGDNLFSHHSNACPYTELKLASLETLPTASSFFLLGNLAEFSVCLLHMPSNV